MSTSLLSLQYFILYTISGNFLRYITILMTRRNTFMRVGLQVPNFTWPNGQSHLGADFAQVVDRAEDAGLYSLWVMDHFFQIRSVGPSENEMLEGWSALAFAAGRTKRIRLGTMVTGVTYRYPGILVKTATTLDVLSEGRAYLGIGAAWNEEEHIGLGVPFPPTAERFERLEETLQIALQMWAGDEKPYNGKYYHLARLLNSPQAVQKPHPPILIGGGGERKTLRLVAQYADACNVFGAPAMLQRKYEILRQHCADVGRDPEEIERTTLQMVNLAAETPAQVVDRFGELSDAGAQHVIIGVRDVHDVANVERIGRDVIPQLRG